MEIGRVHWLVAVAAAALVHAAVAAAIFWEDRAASAQSAGLGGIEVSLGPAGGVSGAKAAVAPPPPPPEEPKVVEKKPEPEPPVEEKPVVLVGERLVEICGPALDAGPSGERRELVRVAPDQDRIGHHPVTVGKQHAALLPHGNDRPQQMLVGAHAAGHAVHDDTEAPDCHRTLP